MPEPTPGPDWTHFRPASEPIPVPRFSGKFERAGGMVDPRDVHRCDDKCVCPIHETQLYYAPQADTHACQDPNCVHAHGMVYGHGMPNPYLSGFESVKVMRLQPDDVIVVQYKDSLSDDHYRMVVARARGVFPDHRVVVLDSDTQITVARPDGV